MNDRKLDDSYWGPGRIKPSNGGGVMPSGGQRIDREGNRVAGGDTVHNSPGQVGRGIEHAEEQPPRTR
jgi:hypothetical protein